MTNKQQPGDRCQVVTAHGTWLNATIISTREGHGGALVRVDGWNTDVWAKPSEIRDNPVNPTSAKRGNYKYAQPVEVQRSMGRWVEGSFSHWENDNHKRAYVYAGAFEPERFHYTNIRTPRVAPDPHDTAYQGEVGDHQPRTTETVAKYGHVAKDDTISEVSVELTPKIPTLGKLTGETIGNSSPWARLRELADELTAPKTTTTAAVAVAATLQMDEALTQLGAVTNSTREKIGYIEAAADFAMMGITPEQLRDYISAFAHTIVTGATPEEVERFARQTLRDKYNRADEGLHHITREYRGAK